MNIIDIAKECGGEIRDTSWWPESAPRIVVQLSAAQLESFADRIRADALEEAAKECEKGAHESARLGIGSTDARYDHMADGAAYCASAIRSLKKGT